LAGSLDRIPRNAAGRLLQGVVRHLVLRITCGQAGTDVEWRPSLSWQALIVIEELYTLTFWTAVHIKRNDILAGIGQIAEQQLPTTGCATYSNWHLAERLHRPLASDAIH